MINMSHRNIVLMTHDRLCFLNLSTSLFLLSRRLGLKPFELTGLLVFSLMKYTNIH